jgi:ribonuclease BN (tRNA processing enzyme)
VELTVLGASGSWPDRGTALSGYLIQHDGFNLWMDAGSGTMANLQKYISIGDVHGMILTHEHADHCVDVYPLFYARYYARKGVDHLPLYIPRGFGTRIHALLSDDSINGFHIGFDVHEVGADESFEVGPFRATTHAMSHLGLPALGFRLSADGAALAYTGDTGPSPAVVELAKDADMFLAEATYQDTDQLTEFHLSARQAGQLAREAGVGKLVLTHILPSHDKVRSRAQASEEFDGSVEAADEGMRFQIGS